MPTDRTPIRTGPRIYMDYNGSAPLHAAARAAMLPFLSADQGNPSSGHWAAAGARGAIEDARASVAGLIGAEPGEIVFTSGGTEANNFVLKGIADLHPGAHVITSAIEHDAVLRPLRHLRSRGIRTTIVKVDGGGVVDPDAVRRAIRLETRLISIMHANNETGVVQPIAEIAAIARAHGISMHSDAAQSVGKITTDVGDLGVDFLSVAAHKIGGPNGIGAVFVRQGMRLTQLLHGGGQEGRRRGGTESALLAAGFAAAARVATGKDTRRIGDLRDRLWEGLVAASAASILQNGDPRQRVPNTLSVSFPGLIGADILARLPHLAATTGSACHAGCVDMSHVLLAMGKSLDIGIGTIRLSLGDGNSVDDVDRVIEDIARATR